MRDQVCSPTTSGLRRPRMASVEGEAYRMYPSRSCTRISSLLFFTSASNRSSTSSRPCHREEGTGQ